MLQVVLHAQIASEDGRFDLEAIARGIGEKLIRRPPHVFGEAITKDSAAVKEACDLLNSSEKAEAPLPASRLSDSMAGEVRCQPALAGAMTISQKAAKAGFEWEGIEGSWEKVHEELDGLKEAVASGDKAHAQEELGDILFTLVNVARWCSIRELETLWQQAEAQIRTEQRGAASSKEND